MDYKDYYQILGIDKKASQDEIKRAYRKLARKFHPDVSQEANAEDRFKELGEAYEVLKDPEKRAAYDQLGSHWKAGQEFHPPPGWDQGFEFHGGGFTGGDSFGFSDFFESLFGRAYQGASHGQARQVKAADTHAKIAIDLEDSYTGATRAISLKHTELSPDGRPQLKSRTLNVRIPKGVREGQYIRLAGQGDPGFGHSEPGDLFLEVTFLPHKLYKAEGYNVYLELPVAPWEAALGATVKVPTPTGKVDLKIPPGSADGRQLRLKGRGIPSKQAGDFYVVLSIALPEANSEEAKAAYAAMAKSFDFNPRAKLGVE